MDPRRQLPAHRSAGNHPLGVEPELGQKLDALRELLRQLAPGAIAVSGGLDSRLLSHIAVESGGDYLCLHFSGPHVAPRETKNARIWLESLSLPYSIVDIDPLVIAAVAANARDRCYHCKHHLFATAQKLAPGRTLIDGTNASDHGTYRPGLQALAELVRSPFAESGVTKDEIMALAHALVLKDPEQPATPCMLTRLPYDTAVSASTLARIAELEDKARNAGFTHFRVRLVGGHPTLFALEGAQDRGLAGPDGMDVAWVGNLSGFWDRAD